MTVDKIINLTAGENCPGEGDYLTWKDAQWNVTGNVNQESMIKEEDLCYHSNQTLYCLLTYFLTWKSACFPVRSFQTPGDPL